MSSKFNKFNGSSFSEVYSRVKDKYHKNYDFSSYEPLEVKRWKDKEGSTYHGQVKKGTTEKHGRVCKTD